MQQDSDPTVFAVSSVSTAAALVVAGTRFYVRAFVVKQLKWDDLFATLAVIGVVATFISTIVAHAYDDGNGGTPTVTLKAVFASFFAYWFAIWAIKMSTLAVCLIIFGHIFAIGRTVYVLGTIVTLHALSAILSLLLQCRPISTIWDLKDYHEKCDNSLVIYIAHAAINLAMDCLVYSMPLILVIRSPMDATRKKYLITIFAIGFVTLLAAIGRLVALIIFFHEMLLAIAWDMLSICTIVEVATGIVATSLPILAPLFKHRLQSRRDQHIKLSNSRRTDDN